MPSYDTKKYSHNNVSIRYQLQCNGTLSGIELDPLKSEVNDETNLKGVG